jgi:hypothetical protein
LSPEMDQLPLPRPLNCRTPMLYAVAKHPIMRAFKDIVKHTQALGFTTYERTLELDVGMRAAYQAIPDVLQRRDVGESFLYPSALIWDRANIELLYLKGLIVLHRRYIRGSKTQPGQEESRQYCVDAALEMLKRQEDMTRACQPGGRLHAEQSMLTTLNVFDFVLAAMVICLDLGVRMTGSENQQSEEIKTLELAALRMAKSNFEACGPSHEAAIAAQTVDSMLTVISYSSAPDSLVGRTAIENGPATNEHTVLHERPRDLVQESFDSLEPVDWPTLDEYFQRSMFEVEPPICG